MCCYSVLQKIFFFIFHVSLRPMSVVVKGNGNNIFALQSRNKSFSTFTLGANFFAAAAAAASLSPLVACVFCFIYLFFLLFCFVLHVGS